MAPETRNELNIRNENNDTAELHLGTALPCGKSSILARQKSCQVKVVFALQVKGSMYASGRVT